MEDCKHPRVQNFKFADGLSAPLWGCADCSHKFVPINLPMEQDAERYRWLRSRSHEGEDMSSAAGYQWLDTGTYRKKLPADAVPEHWQTLHTQAALNAAVAAERERCAALLDAEHELRKHLDNHAAVCARVIRGA